MCTVLSELRLGKLFPASDDDDDNNKADFFFEIVP